MKKLEIKNKEYFGIKTFEVYEKRILTLLKEVDLEKVSLLDIKQVCTFREEGKIFSTIFYFKIGTNGFIRFFYEKNKKKLE